MTKAYVPGRACIDDHIITTETTESTELKRYLLEKDYILFFLCELCGDINN